MSRGSKNENSILSGLAWSYGERFAAQIVSLIVSIILARLIAPSEYGVISLVIIFIGFANIFATEGFGTSLIQKKDSDELDFSTLFWFSMAVSFVLMSVLWIISKPVSIFYNSPALTWVMRIMSLKLPVASINSIQRAYVSKRMEFRKFFYSTFLGTIISAVVGVTMAYNGFGVWALVGQYLVNSYIDTLVLFITVKWKPSLHFSKTRLTPLLAFGWKVLAVSLLNSLYSNLRNFIIGKIYSPEDLAYTNKGQQFPSLISLNINVAITNVIFPALSNIQEDRERVLSLTRRAIQSGTFLMAPLLIGLAAVAKPVVSIVLTDKWLPCVPYLQIMCFVYLLQPVQTASIQAMKALGYSRLYLFLEIIKKVFGFIILIVICLYTSSVEAIVWSALAAEIISTAINFPANKKIMGYIYFDQFIDFGKSIISSLLMWLIIHTVNQVANYDNQVIVLVINIVIGMISYLLISFIIKDRGGKYIFQKTKNLIRRPVNGKE